MYQSIQGNLGLGKAIKYFSSNNMVVAIPLNDTQKYDLVAEIDGKLSRISVKTSRFSTSNKKSFVILLKNCGGASGKTKKRLFNNNSCDYVFCVIGDGRMFLIPSKNINAVNAIKVGIKYLEYEVKSKLLCDFIN